MIARILCNILIIYFTTINIKCYVEANDINMLSESDTVENRKRDKRAIFNPVEPEWIPPIPYLINDTGLEDFVEQVLFDIENNTCLTFERITDRQDYMIEYVKGTSDCKITKEDFDIKIVNVAPHCRTLGAVYQMTLKVLGLINEERRPDRNNYVSIRRNNIYQNKRRKFNIIPRSDLYLTGLRYDFGSILHNGRRYESRNGLMTIIPKNSYYLKTIGQTKEMSFNDVKSLNMYYCYDVCLDDLDCLNGAYPDPKDCTKCRCPRFYTGKRCGLIANTTDDCGTTKLTANSTIQTLEISGVKSCIYQIVAPELYNVELAIEEYDFPARSVCPPDFGLEIKFLFDKSVAGPRFCGYQKNIFLQSIGRGLTMKYVGTRNTDYVKMFYYQK
uniref:Metalloendopeptidase n=1 Tax=Strongyloides papillosus TaxID=174720 RepID=A0A0N5C136_STREA